MSIYLHKVGVRCLETGVWGAYYNILINLPDIKDETYKEQVRLRSKFSYVNIRKTLLRGSV